VSSDCVLAGNSCCSPCGVPGLDAVDAVNRERVDEHRSEVCQAPVPCPACPESVNPSLVTSCESGACAAHDVTELPLSSCTADAQCRLRARDCCECGAALDFGNLIAIAAGEEGPYAALVCDPEQACDACAPVYPTDVEAFCDADGHCATRPLAEDCDTLVAQYSAALDESLRCDPNADIEQCTEPISSGLACACGAFANPEHQEALDRAASASASYHAAHCGDGIVCGPCNEPIFGRCSRDGACEGVYSSGARGCKVNGVLYADGEGGIPDPVSCNTCSCYDGELACTEIGCPMPCPDGTALGKQCAACGPTDACLIVEHACLPTCTDACESDALCLGGLCVTGVCG